MTLKTFENGISIPVLLLAAALSGCGGEAEQTPPAGLTTEYGVDGRELASCTPLCDGACKPIQLAQSSGLDQPILPVGEHVYFSGAITYEASYSYFGRASKQGGASSLLAQNLQRPPLFLSNATSAYAVLRYPGNSGFSHVNKLGADGSITPVPGIDGSRSLSITTVDATHLHSLNVGDNTVWSTPLTGGGAWTQATRSIANEAGRSVRVDGSGVYIVTDDVAKKQSTVWRAPRRNLATATRLVTVPGSIVSLTLDETDIYFADRTGGLFRASKSGGAATRLASTANGLSVAVDAERYYWFDGSALTATCKSSGASQVLTPSASPLTSTPGILAVDAEGVYWRNHSQVWKIAR